MRHEDYKQLLALEAVGALEEGERGALLAHLPACEGCRAELAELADAAASLAYTVAPVPPPPRMRADILARVRAGANPEVLAAPSEAEAPSEARGGSRVPPPGRGGRAPLEGFSLWQLLAWRPALAFGAAAALAGLVLLGATTLALWGRNRTLSAEVARLSGQLREAEGELAGQREQLAGARDVDALLSAPATRVAEMSGKRPAPQAHASIAYDRATGRAVIMATGLPPCPAGHEYQLWLIADNKPLPGGTFKTDAAGRARMSDRLPPGHAAPTFAVTLERQGGAPAPEGAVFLLGS
ncbi:MAG TPA: anti-sigma factor [Pyrinomonadaceae bacterium]|jgi:hypothetical protein